MKLPSSQNFSTNIPLLDFTIIYLTEKKSSEGRNFSLHFKYNGTTAIYVGFKVQVLPLQETTTMQTYTYLKQKFLDLRT